MHYFLIAGEASGDLHAGELISALKAKDPEAQFTFLGGDCMAKAADSQPIIHYRDMAFMGFSEVIRHIGRIGKNLKRAKSAIKATKPDALILIDYPSFNLKVAKTAVKCGIPVYYYIPPKVWAWKKWRIKTIRKLIRKVYAIFPFEPAFYHENNANAVYVGNPSLAEVDNALKSTPSREDFLQEYKLRDRPMVALMPGSRASEIRNNLPIMAAGLDRFAQYRGVIIGAPGLDDSIYTDCGVKLPIIRPSSAVHVLSHCRAAIVTSGTATLETALAGIPQVAVYRANGSKLSYKIMERLLNINWVTLPNLIAQKTIIPELLLHNANPSAIADALMPLLANAPERERMLNDYAQIREILGTAKAAETTANDIYADLSATR